MAEQDVLERPFDIREMFFSRTDFKGKVLSGNQVFQRVSGYDWTEMYNRAHNIVRHPDMPKGVFHLFWSFLENKKPIGAYVKNKAKDGRPYWVFAVAVPLEDGYLSVRIKPSSQLFPIIQAAYADLKKRETSDKLTPAQSEELLLKQIRVLGYSSYEKLMTECFLHELESRQKIIGGNSLGVIELLKEASHLGASLSDELTRVIQTQKESKFLPLNLEVSSAHLNEEGAAISVVASSYQKLVAEVQSEISRFKESAENVILKLQENQFLISAKYLMTEIVTFFKTEKDNTNINVQEETTRLLEQSEKYQTKAQASVQDVLQSLKTFKSACESMRSSITGLEIMRLTGKIEAARLGQASKTFEGIIGQLKQFQMVLFGVLEEIEKNTFKLQNCSEGILESSQKEKNL